MSQLHITGINTSGISINQELNQVIWSSSCIGLVQLLQILEQELSTISSPTLNTTGGNNVVSFGSTVFSNYALDFFDEENQDTTFESNEIIESEADDIIDFSEGNPFGTF